MGLLSIFKRQDESAAAVASAPDAVVAARTRARRRLIGATLLLALGVIGFPLLFESQPRPIPVDIPIEIPRKESVPALVLPPAPTGQGIASAPGTATLGATGRAAQTAAQALVQAPAPVPIEAPAAAAKASAAALVAAGTAASSERPATAPSTRPDDGRRAQALLDGRPPAAASPTPRASDAAMAMRLVVQVGAYSDADKLREARQKVEGLGLKTYTQVVESDAGRRTRVRVGPFASRDEAEQAAARIRSQGLPAAILVL